jgi:hypothetical protein
VIRDALNYRVIIPSFYLTTIQNEPNSIPYLYNRNKWTGWMDLNPRPPTFQEMPNFIIFVGIIHIIIGLKFELVSRLSNHGFSYFIFE